MQRICFVTKKEVCWMTISSKNAKDLFVYNNSSKKNGCKSKSSLIIKNILDHLKSLKLPSKHFNHSLTLYVQLWICLFYSYQTRGFLCRTISAVSYSWSTKNNLYFLVHPAQVFVEKESKKIFGIKESKSPSLE